jgi:hypothetical protein
MDIGSWIQSGGTQTTHHYKSCQSLLHCGSTWSRQRAAPSRQLLLGDCAFHSSRAPLLVTCQAKARPSSNSMQGRPGTILEMPQTGDRVVDPQLQVRSLSTNICVIHCFPLNNLYTNNRSPKCESCLYRIYWRWIGLYSHAGTHRLRQDTFSVHLEGRDH